MRAVTVTVPFTVAFGGIVTLVGTRSGADAGSNTRRRTTKVLSVSEVSRTVRPSSEVTFT